MHSAKNFRRGFSAVGLHHPKNMLNVGEVMRAVGCYEAAMLAVTGTRYQRSRTDTQAAHKHFPMFVCDDLKSMLPFGATPVAVDLIDGAVALPEYQHPESAFYIFGPEDGTLGSEILDWCRDVVYVPTRRCMNLAATVNVVLYDRLAKELSRQGEKNSKRNM